MKLRFESPGTILFFLIAITVFPSPGHAEPAPSYLNLIHGAAFAATLDISLDGTRVHQELPFATHTGGQGLKPGRHTLSIHAEHHDPADIRLNARQGASLCFVALSVIKENPRTDDPPYALRILPLEPAPRDSSYAVTAVWADPRGPGEITLAGITRVLKFGTPTSFPEITPGFSILSGGKSISRHRLEDPGHYFVVLSPKNGTGPPVSILVYDARYQPPTF